MLINEEQIKFYNDNGFLKIDNFFNGIQVKELRSFVDEAMSSKNVSSIHNSLKNRSHYRSILNQKINVWLDHEGMKNFAFNKDLATIASKLSGKRYVRMFQDQILIKDADNSKPTPWHQDLNLWPMNETSALTAWIALDDVDESNGCMQFLPGSHKLGKINFVDQNKILDYGVPTVMKLQAGSLHFHNSLTLHYAFANSSLEPRRAYAIVYLPEGITYNGLPYPVTDGQNLVIRNEIQGKWFPKLS